MSVFDVLVNTDDLIVLGPPDIIDVNVSIGQQGQRGSVFYARPGDPNSAENKQFFIDQNISPAYGDLFINTQSGSKYGWLYLYNPKVTEIGNQWDELLKLQPPIYSLNTNPSFISGQTTISIPLSDFVTDPLSILTENNFVINLTANNSVPTLLTILSKSIVSNNLDISVSGLKYENSSWSPLTGSIVISMNIAIL